MIKRKAVVIEDLCVACGACVDECPVNAIEIFKGMFAKVDEKKCVGCSRMYKSMSCFYNRDDRERECALDG